MTRDELIERHYALAADAARIMAGLGAMTGVVFRDVFEHEAVETLRRAFRQRMAEVRQVADQLRAGGAG